MNKKIAALVIGGIFTISAFGFGYSVNAAEKSVEQKPAMHSMMQGGQMDAKAMEEMMKDPAKCVEMMKSPEMQTMMKDMMKTPEMQVMMKQMLQNDAELHKIMLDLVNSVDMSEHDHAASGTPASDHNSHH